MSSPMSSPSQVKKLSPEELNKWREKVSKGFERGEVVTLDFRYISSIMMSSKGNVAIATPYHLFIVVNLPWQPFQEFLDSVVVKHDARLEKANIVLRIIKSEPQRKFSLAEAIRFELYYPFVRGYTDLVIEKENEKVEIEGVEFLVTEGVRRYFQERGELIFYWNPKTGKYEQRFNVVERIKLREERVQSVIFRVANPTKQFGRILQKYLELRQKPSFDYAKIYIFGDNAAADIRLSPREVGVMSFVRYELPTEEELREVSKFYTIAVPRLYIVETPKRGRDRHIAFIDLWYHGVKYTVVILGDPSKTKLLFRCLRNRYSISTYAKKVLPRGYVWVKDLILDAVLKDQQLYSKIFNDVPFGDYKRNLAYVKNYMGFFDVFNYPDIVNYFTNFIRSEILPKVRNLHTEPKIIDPLTAFVEAFYAQTPKKKIDNVVKRWIEIYEKVKDLAPKATLYIVFYGRRKDPNFVGFRVDKDGTVSAMPNRYVPVSGITMKGGDFERLYRETYVKKLFEYQIAPKSEKLEILWNDINEVREMLRSMNMDSAAAKFDEVKSALMNVARDYSGDNIVLLFFKYLESLRRYKPREVDLDNVATLLIGLIKTGERNDLQKLLQYNALRALRAVVKYEMKRRGYSIRKGVLFLGNPEEVKRKILEVVRGLHGRLAALFESLQIPPETVEQLDIYASLSRVEALLSF